MMDIDKLKVVLRAAHGVVSCRDGDITTEDGSMATTDIDFMIELDMALADACELDSDNVTGKDAFNVARAINNMEL